MFLSNVNAQRKFGGTNGARSVRAEGDDGIDAGGSQRRHQPGGGAKHNEEHRRRSRPWGGP
jgi:hypothetical protein